EETLNMLKEIGVHYAQGMHIDKPKNIDEVRKNNSLAS
ncbi:hypothetical protein MNBD_GAMMA25-2489, partial [hydrothermal vent metagenome]